MAAPTTTVWKAEPHTLAKHQILRYYLGAWFTILQKQGYKRIAFIDGFCGPGKYEDGESGSPIIALEEAHKCSAINEQSKVSFFFIEKDRDRYAHLCAELEKISRTENFKIIKENGEFSSIFGKAINDFEKGNKQLPPSFLFVDPFGFSGVPFQLIKRYFQYPTTEAFITVMSRDIDRFIPDSGKHNAIAEFYGTNDVLSLIGEKERRNEKLVRFYHERLQSIDEKMHVRSFQMRNKVDRDLYYLFFATKHSRGYEEMKKAMWRVDESGRFSFSDAANPNQEALTELYDHKKELFRELQSLYSGSVVEGSVVKQYVIDKTIYLNKHKTESLKYGEENGLIEVERAGGKARSRGQFPDDCKITFRKIG